jgi:hypothetical protein
LREALGVSSPELARTLLIQTACASEVKGFADLQGCKSLAAALRGIGPKDESEAMLAAQMVITHTLSMRFLGSTSPVQYPNPAKPEPNRHRKLSAVTSQLSENNQCSVGRRRQRDYDA